MPIRDVDCDTVDVVTIVGGYGLMRSGGYACASTVDTSKCVDGCDSPVLSTLVSSGWRFSVGGGMRLIRETCAIVSVDLSTRRNH